jgi:hypothetical protein
MVNSSFHIKNISGNRITIDSILIHIISIALSFVAPGVFLRMLAESMILETYNGGMIKIVIPSMPGFILGFILGKVEGGN